MERLRALGLQNTELAHAQVDTIRHKLFKIGAVITRNTRRVRIFPSNTYPHQALYWQVVQNLAPG
ncbi:hypothetical Protein YC6258_03476 [Gynuella sunshinyii YC6258]|uniref:Transposase DDE domain-containing protein n=2 Tax=Gynuella sunshinyii TaxID=1445505 RepID=A0A0C5VLC9_9GAMM|nr:hypothetical Protein YC6258_03476 [Gynuella sunshinyii YC6258]